MVVQIYITNVGDTHTRQVRADQGLAYNSFHAHSLNTFGVLLLSLILLRLETPPKNDRVGNKAIANTRTHTVHDH